MSKLDDLIQEMKIELGADFVSTDIVNMSDGISVAGGSVIPDFDSVAASARFTMIMKLASKVADKTGMGNVEDTLTTTETAYIITRLLGDGSYYFGLAVTQNATLGMVRLIMKDYANQFWEAIPR